MAKGSPVLHKSAKQKIAERQHMSEQDVERERKLVRSIGWAPTPQALMEALTTAHKRTLQAHVFITHTVYDMVPVNIRQNPFWERQPELYALLHDMDDFNKRRFETNYQNAKQLCDDMVALYAGRSIDYTPEYAPAELKTQVQPPYTFAESGRGLVLERNGIAAAMGYEMVSPVAISRREFRIEWAAMLTAQGPAGRALMQRHADLVARFEASCCVPGTKSTGNRLRFNERHAMYYEEEARVIRVIECNNAEELVKMVRRSGTSRAQLAELQELSEIIDDLRGACANLPDAQWVRWHHRETFDLYDRRGADALFIERARAAQRTLDQARGEISAVLAERATLRRLAIESFELPMGDGARVRPVKASRGRRWVDVLGGLVSKSRLRAGAGR